MVVAAAAADICQYRRVERIEDKAPSKLLIMALASEVEKENQTWETNPLGHHAHSRTVP